MEISFSPLSKSRFSRLRRDFAQLVAVTGGGVFQDQQGRLTIGLQVDNLPHRAFSN